MLRTLPWVGLGSPVPAVYTSWALYPLLSSVAVSVLITPECDPQVQSVS